MVTISNVFYNVPDWASGQTIAIGDWRASDGAAWQASSAGITGNTAPTGTSDCNDGGVAWNYKARIDFTDINDYLASFTSMTEPRECWLWNTGEIVLPYISSVNRWIQPIMNHGTSSGNTLTIKAAPGQSFADNPNAITNILAYYPTNGVAIRPDSIFYDYSLIFEIREDIIFEGLQFFLPRYWRSAFSAIFGGSAAIFRNCIFDFFPGVMPDSDMLAFSVNYDIYSANSYYQFENCLFLDRQPVGHNRKFVQLSNNSSAGSAVNCTFIAVNSPGGTSVALATFGTAIGTVKNCAIFGYGVPVFGQPTTPGVFDHNICSASSVDSTTVTDTGSQFGKSTVSQFLDTLGDYRLRIGADCIDAGTSVGAPSSDILGTARPQGAAFDVGCNEFIPDSQTVGVVGAIITFLG